MNFKKRIIKEMKETIEGEQITLEDFFEMLEYASTVELCLLKSNFQKLLKMWKGTKQKSRSLFLH